MTDNTTPAWDGAAEVKDRDGDLWIRNSNGRYALLTSGSDRSLAALQGDYGPCTWVEPQPAPQPPSIHVICGSTRQRAQIEMLNRELTLDGGIVLAPGVFVHDGETVSDDTKAALDDLHLRKIDMADYVHIIRKPDGSLGESTSRERQHAETRGKRIITHPGIPQPRTLTWRRDGTGCAWWEMDAELVDGRQVTAEFDGRYPSTTIGPYRDGFVGTRYIQDGPESSRYLASVTVTLPEEPDTSSWDAAEVVEVGGECWQRISFNVWHPMGIPGNPSRSTTAELAERGPVRVVVDRVGKAVR